MPHNFTTYFGTFDVLSKSSFLRVHSDFKVNQDRETFLILILLLTLRRFSPSEDLFRLKYYTIVKQCFWIQIKFITEHSNSIHTIIITRLLKLNEVIN